MNKCIKIVLNKCLNRDMKEIKKIVRDMSYRSCKASNKAMRMWLHHAEDMIAKKNEDNNFDSKQYEKDTYGKTYKNVIEGEMKKLMPLCNTLNVGTLHKQSIQNAWGRLKGDILSCKVNLPTFKIDTPYYFKNSTYNIERDKGGKFIVGLSFFSREGLKEYGFKIGENIIMSVDKLNGNEKSTLNKIILGKEYVDELNKLKSKLRNKKLTKEEIDAVQQQIKQTENNFENSIKKGEVYKQGSAQILINKKGKIEFIISFSFESVKKELDKNRTLGIDLGIVNVATMSVYDSSKDKYDYVNYRYNIMSGKELLAFRQKLFNMGMSEKEIEDKIFNENNKKHQSQLNKCNIGCIDGLSLIKHRETNERYRNDLNISTKYCGEGRLGHGRKTRQKPIDKIRNRISNFQDTFNHKYSRYIVNFAVKNNCGNIQMEDLSGFSANTDSKFLKRWSYYDLQSKIKYKAEEQGVKVTMINPKYTSKRCSVCGNIHDENRDCKNNQAKFECKICGHTDNADVNASKNIAIPYIDKIIEEYIESKNFKNK